MKRFISLTVILFLFSSMGLSQNNKHPWLLGVSTNYVDFNVIEKPLGQQFSNANWMGKQLPTMARIGRYINNSLNLSFSLATVTLEVDKLNNIPVNSHITSDFFWKIGGSFEYKFANDYFLSQSSFIDPYIILGLNGSTINNITYLSQSTGVGLNIWVSNDLGFNFQGTYDYIFNYNDYTNYSFGLVVKFGHLSDKDRDGIPNKADACPKIFGVEMLQGCPDYDGDGIVDSLDRCPREFGYAEAEGCPDYDGDYIPDMEDRCPCDPGPGKLNGCPDRDRDGILDKDDECPNEKGTKECNGCPDSDLDLVPDKWDNCPTEKGTKENCGCPVVAKVTVAQMPFIVTKEIEKVTTIRSSDTGYQIPYFDANIEFDLEDATIKRKSYVKLDNILKFMFDHPEYKFSIYGYTDNTGPWTFNQKLSELRAFETKKYFTDRGISPERILAMGFGTSNPIATNNTSEGQAKNRRVEIRVIK